MSKIIQKLKNSISNLQQNAIYFVILGFVTASLVTTVSLGVMTADTYFGKIISGVMYGCLSLSAIWLTFVHAELPRETMKPFINGVGIVFIIFLDIVAIYSYKSSQEYSAQMEAKNEQLANAKADMLFHREVMETAGEKYQKCLDIDCGHKRRDKKEYEKRKAEYHNMKKAYNDEKAKIWAPNMVPYIYVAQFLDMKKPTTKGAQQLQTIVAWLFVLNIVFQTYWTTHVKSVLDLKNGVIKRNERATQQIDEPAPARTTRPNTKPNLQGVNGGKK